MVRGDRNDYNHEITQQANNGTIRRLRMYYGETEFQTNKKTKPDIGFSSDVGFCFLIKLY
jgi:hypothetical protein